MGLSFLKFSWADRFFGGGRDERDEWSRSDVLPVRVHGTQFTATSAAPVRFSAFDQPLVFVTLGLLLWGLVMVYSA